MRAVVLVGGQGTRLRPLTLTTPKQMLPVGNRPMIEWVVGHLGQHGVERVVLSLGYRPDAFLAAYPSGMCAGVALQYAVEDSPLDTAGAIRFAARAAGIEETFLVVNGDVLTDLDVSALVDFHRARQAEATIHLTPVEDPSRFGVVPTDEDGRVEAFIEKPPRDEAPTNLINGGTYVLEPSVLDRIPDDRPVSIERETFPALVADRSLFAMASSAAWVDAGTAATFLAANLRHASASCIGDGVAASATVQCSVLGSSVTIGPDAVVERSVLMDGCAVMAGASVRDSVIGPEAVVEPSATVDACSLIGPGALVAQGAVVSAGRVPAP
ncbi:MAG: NDP-sugar synthase [Acidimicrobiaceae bacterium]|nr:NDP-sugar synthase [Acidimicrobiaceae bacterium]